MHTGKRWVMRSVILILVIISIGWVKQLQSQEKYPTRAIDMIVVFSPGGGQDVLARLTASQLNKKWGVPVNVINKPGGNTVPGNLEVYSLAPNGYTILVDGPPSSSMLGVVVKDLPFKVLDRTLIAMVSCVPMALMVPASSPYKTLNDVIAEAKRDPENFTWTSIGGASGQDFITRQFFKAIGVDVMKTNPVMCKGGAQATALTAGGNVKLGSTVVISAKAAIQAGTIRLLAIAKERNPDFPDVPTTAELGYPTINAVMWYGISGPPKMSPHIVDIWDKALREMLHDPVFVSQLKNVGNTPFYLNSSEMREYVKKEMEELKELYGIK